MLPAIVLGQITQLVPEVIRGIGFGYYLATKSVGLIGIQLQATGNVYYPVSILNACNNAVVLGIELGPIPAQRRVTKDWDQKIRYVDSTIHSGGTTGPQFKPFELKARVTSKSRDIGGLSLIHI